MLKNRHFQTTPISYHNNGEPSIRYNKICHKFSIFIFFTQGLLFPFFCLGKAIKVYIKLYFFLWRISYLTEKKYDWGRNNKALNYSFTERFIKRIYKKDFTGVEKDVVTSDESKTRGRVYMI